MFRPVVVLLLLAALAVAAPLLAQEPSVAPPRLEAGLDVGVTGPDGGFDQTRAILAPRLTMNLTPQTALSVSGDVFVNRQYIGESWAESRVVTAEMRRGLVQAGRFAMSGLVGGGVGWTQSFQPQYTYRVRDEPVTVPASIRTLTGPEMTFGAGLEQRLTPRLALRQEVRAVIGRVSEFRAQIGVNVPVGRYPAQRDPWRTRDGRRPDSLANGTRIGALVGAAAMAGFVGFLGSLLCEGDCDNLAGPIALGAGYGAGAGALTGALIDSFRE